MRFYNIFFSPTGGTKKVADIVAKGTKLEAEKIDLIKEPDKLMKVKFEKKDLCLVAVPSYGGRIPSVVTDMFRKVKADGTKAILVDCMAGCWCFICSIAWCGENGVKEWQ